MTSEVPAERDVVDAVTDHRLSRHRIQDLDEDEELWNARLEDCQFLTARIAVCEALSNRPRLDERTGGVPRRNATTIWAETDKAEALNRGWLQLDPRWSWDGSVGWIAADHAHGAARLEPLRTGPAGRAAVTKRARRLQLDRRTVKAKI